MASQVPPEPLTAPAIEALQRVPGLQNGQRPRSIERLGGGTVNEVFRVDTAEGRFVLRLNGASWRRPGVDRERELSLHRAAAAGGIAPPIVVADPKANGLLIMEYHEGRTWEPSDYSDLSALIRLGERLSALHRLHPPDVAAFDPFQVALSYASIIGAHEQLQPQMDRLRSLCECARADVRPTIVHGDLWQGNILQGSRLWLLDWEYAQLSNPLMDIACLLAYYPQAAPYRHELAAAAGLDSRSLEQELADRVAIYRILSWLWSLARREAAIPP